MQQTAVDRGRSQNDNSLKIARGPQKKNDAVNLQRLKRRISSYDEQEGAFSLFGTDRFLCVDRPHRTCTAYHTRRYTLMAVFLLFRDNFTDVLKHRIQWFESSLQKVLGTEVILYVGNRGIHFHF